ncbi:TRIC cation channel family protein [Variovorax sp. 160MFSha2.1]|uniref:TRIC cation channel family protein n=1 Tax=Variovorax sp. 160MFSha2.1 TaxID=3158367 RepID=UPI003AACAD45
MLLQVLDFTGFSVFALSGVVAAGRAGLDRLGVVVIASGTSVGGPCATCCAWYPVFWGQDARYVYVILAAAVIVTCCVS